MPATSKITFINECRSFVSGQYTEKRDAPNRIPRPPNAFMLYRSDFLKRRAIPPEVEKRQQNLSRIAGQCWNMLPETEKDIWHSKAAAVRAEHRARYPSYKTGPFHKDTNSILTKDKRRGSTTINSGRSFSRSRTRRTQARYCESMFAALHDSNFSSPASQSSLLPPTPVSVACLSTTASPSPLLLPQLLPPFTSDIHSSGSGSEIPQCDLSQISRDLEIIPTEIGSSQEQYPTLQQYEDSFATCVPYPGLEQLPELRCDPVAPVPLTLPESNAFSPERYHLADCPSSTNNFGVTAHLAHFDQSSVPLYPWQSDELNTSSG